MHARFIQFNYREWNSELPIRQQLLFGCSNHWCRHKRIRKREGITHKAEVCITRGGITRPEFLWQRPYPTHADTLDPKRSLFTTNVKAVGDTCVTTAHGQGVRNQSDQNQQRQEVCFSMSGDALTLRSGMSKKQVFICMQAWMWECQVIDRSAQLG